MKRPRPTPSAMADDRVEDLPEQANASGEAVFLAGLAIVLLVLVGVVWFARTHSDREPPSASQGAGELNAVPDPPMSMPADGAYTLIDVLPSGSLAVQQWIHSSAPIFSVRISAPVDPLLPTGTARGTQLAVVAEGIRVSSLSQVGPRGRVFSLLGIKSLYLSYVLTGALEISPDGGRRALARVTSLDLDYEPHRGPTTVAFRGARVLSLACTPALIDGAPEPCGVEEAAGWQVLLPAPGYRVMAQLDLLDPGEPLTGQG